MVLTVDRKRRTKETDISLKINFDGSGKCEVTTNLPFFDHMLSSMGKHGRFDIDIRVKGDLDVDDHHVVEDVGIVLGEAIHEALEERGSVRRFGSAIVPMDDALVLLALDLGGRSYLDAKLEFSKKHAGSFGLNNIKHFLRSLSDAGKLNLHVKVLAGEDDHHLAEAVFKALGIGLRAAIEVDPSLSGSVPSTKGTL